MVYNIIFNFFDEHVMVMIYSGLSSENFVNVTALNLSMSWEKSSFLIFLQSKNIFIEERRAA